MKLPVEWLAPAGLALGALLVPLVLLYILKVRRQRRTVPSVWLWQAARRDLMARSPFQRLRVQVPLLLQAAALLALALGAARPATRSKEIDGEHVAFVIDTSASMSALDAPSGKTRIELAKAAARELALGLPPGADAMVIDAGRDARVALPPDRDNRRLRAALESLAARDVEGDLAAAVSLAAGRLKQLGGERRLIVLSDGNLARPDSLQGTAVPVDLVRVGNKSDNAAIVRLDVRSGLDPALGREQLQAFLLVANFGARPVETYLTMRELQASDVLDSRKLRVEPGATEPVVLTFQPAPGDYGQALVFELAPHDAMAVDDVAYGRVPIGRKLPVLYAAAGTPSPWLLRALAADPDAEVRTASFAELASAAATMDPGSFVVVEGGCPTDVPGGDLLLVAPPAGTCHGALVGPVVEGPHITSWDHASPRLRFLSLDGVVVASGRTLEPEGKRAELIRSDQGVLAADVSTSARTATLLGFDVGESNWPLKASFVLFVRNLLEQARLHRSSGVGGPALCGDPLRASVPTATHELQVQGPDGKPHPLVARGGLAIVPEVSHTGIYRLSWSTPRPGSLLVPVNLVSAAESDLRTEPAVAQAPLVTVSAAAQSVAAHHDWSWILALAALGLGLLDVWWLTRTPRRPVLPTASKPRLPQRSYVR